MVGTHIRDISTEMLFVDLNTCSAPLCVNERHSSEIKQLSVAIGMARKQSYSFFGREVDIVWWPVAAKPHLKLSLTFNKRVAQVQLNRHKYTLSHHRRTRQGQPTVEN